MDERYCIRAGGAGQAREQAGQAGQSGHSAAAAAAAAAAAEAASEQGREQPTIRIADADVDEEEEGPSTTNLFKNPPAAPPGTVVLRAPTQHGARRGLVTLAQIFSSPYTSSSFSSFSSSSSSSSQSSTSSSSSSSSPPPSSSSSSSSPGPVQSIDLRDGPVNPWRGLLVDTASHLYYFNVLLGVLGVGYRHA